MKMHEKMLRRHRATTNVDCQVMVSAHLAVAGGDAGVSLSFENVSSPRHLDVRMKKDEAEKLHRDLGIALAGIA